MPTFRISEVAALAGVSPDTARRWIDSGRLSAERDANGHRLVAGADLAAFLRSDTAESDRGRTSARNRLAGLVTAVSRGDVMAQVEIQAGPHRLVSLLSREAVDELDLRPGSAVTAVVKSTSVIVESDTEKGVRHD